MPLVCLVLARFSLTYSSLGSLFLAVSLGLSLAILLLLSLAQVVGPAILF